MRKIEIDKGELYKYYIVENHNTEETAKHFKVGNSTIASRVKEWGFKKTKEKKGEKARATCLERFGYEYALQSPEKQAKMRATNKERRGVENPSQDPKVQDKKRATNMARRGFEYPAQDPGVQAKWRETIKRNGSGLKNKDLTYYTIKKSLENRGIRGRTLTELGEFMGTDRTAAGHYIKNYPELEIFIKRYSKISDPEQKLYEFIKENYGGEIIQSDRKILGGKEIDILLPDLKLGIEFNGLYHHRTMRDPKDTPHKDKYYHQDKARAALEKGYRLIFITDDDWRDNQEEVKCQLLNKLKLASKEDSYYKILGYEEPNYYYTDGKKKYHPNSPNLPKALAKAVRLGNGEWEYAESKGYYRYYDCGYPKIWPIKK